MAPATSEQPIQDLEDAGVSSRFLSGIEIAHDQTELCIMALESIMELDELIDTAQFSVTRLRLAQANLARTQVARQACSHLISVTPTERSETLRDLQRSEIEHFQMISEHIRHWTSQAVQDDWVGYRNATRKVLARARELIATEKKHLVPLLRQAADRT